VRCYLDGEVSVCYLCVSAVQYKNATDYHRDLELAVTKRDHDERDLKLHDIPNGYACRLNCDVSAI
jgi:hypothetical protein